MDSTKKYTLFPPARFGAVAFIAIGAALFGLVATYTGHPIWGLVLAALAGPVGLVGLVRALSPARHGQNPVFQATLTYQQSADGGLGETPVHEDGSLLEPSGLAAAAERTSTYVGRALPGEIGAQRP